MRLHGTNEMTNAKLTSAQNQMIADIEKASNKEGIYCVQARRNGNRVAQSLINLGIAELVEDRYKTMYIRLKTAI